jgi:GGDEF domain-containing protein
MPLFMGSAAESTSPQAAAIDPALEGNLSAAIAACRQARQAVSLLLVELDEFAGLTFALGPRAAGRLVEQLHRACSSVDHPLAECLPTGEAQFALILSNCDRRAAVESAGELVRGVRRLGEKREGLTAKLSISVGVATLNLPPKNFPQFELIDAARRCLHAAKLSGGDCVKSIGIY